MSSLTKKSVPTHASDCREERLDRELLVYCPGTARAVHLNEAAALVWELCNGTRTVGQIVDLLREAYPVAAERIMTDVEQALRRLDESGALWFAGSNDAQTG